MPLSQKQSGIPTRRICTARPASTTVSATALASPPVTKWFSAVTTRGTRLSRERTLSLSNGFKRAYMKERRTHPVVAELGNCFEGPGCHQASADDGHVVALA